MTHNRLHTKTGRWGYTIVALSLLLLPLASGCAATATAAEPVTIRFAGIGDPMYYQPLIEEFSASHPNITVELVEPDDDAVDVYFVETFQLGDLVERNAILSLSPFVQQDESFDAADFYPGTLDICSSEGNLWAVPGGLTMLVLFYNQDLFDQYGVSYPEPGWTWDDFMEKAVALRDPTAGVFGYAPTNQFLDPLPFIYQHGGGLTDDLRNPTRATFDDPLTVEALEWYAALIHEHNVMPRQDQMFDIATIQAGVYSNKVAMWGDWLVYQGGAVGLESPWPGEWKMRWGVVPLPRDAQAGTLVDVLGYVISSQTANPEASWQLVSFLSTQVRSIHARLTPARQSLAESDAYAQLAGRDVATVARESMQGGILLSPIIMQYLGPYGGAIQAILDGDATPQEALASAQRQTNQ